jgi:hypothetical protein
VSAAVQAGPAVAHAVRRFKLGALRTETGADGFPASTVYFDDPQTGAAFSGMASLGASMAARKNFAANFRASRDRGFAIGSWFRQEFRERCFTTSTMRDDRWIRRTTSVLGVLWVASLLAAMDAASKQSAGN